MPKSKRSAPPPPPVDCGAILVGDHDSSSDDNGRRRRKRVGAHNSSSDSNSSSSDEGAGSAAYKHKASSSSSGSSSDGSGSSSGSGSGGETRSRRRGRTAHRKRHDSKARSAGAGAATPMAAGIAMVAPAPGWRTTVITVPFSAKLADLAEEVGSVEVKIDAAAAGLFGEGRPENSILGDVRVIAAKNGFPVSMHATLMGIASLEKADAATATSVSVNGTKGHFTILAGDSIKEPREIVSGLHAREKHPFLEAHPGWNASNIEKGIQHIEGTSKSSVLRGHPILDTVNASLKAARKAPLDPTQQMYMVDTEKIVSLLDGLRKKLELQVPTDDLHKMGIQFSRAVGTVDTKSGLVPWDDAEELLDDIHTDAGRADLLDQTYNCTVQLEIKHRMA